MEINYTKFYLLLFVVYLSLFLWYYATLPGSILSLDKKHPKPKLQSALFGHLMYILPVFLMTFYSNNLDCNKLNTAASRLNTLVSIICKK
jgi:hypothetical protein